MQDYYITLSNGEKIYRFPIASLNLPRAVCNENLQHTAQSAAVTLNYSPELLQLLVQHPVLQAQIFSAQNQPLFTGEIETDVSWTDDGALAEIKDFSLSVNDYSTKFKTKTTTDILLENTTLAAAVAALAKPVIDANPHLSISASLPATPVQVVYIAAGRSVLETLEALVYQYGYSLYFDELGVMQFFSWKEIPETCPDFGETQIQTGLNAAKTNKNYTGVQVSFNTLTAKTNELVYFQGNGYDSNDDPAPFVIQPGVYFPYESTPVYEADHGQVYQSFATGYAEAVKKYNGEYDYQRNAEAKLLYSKNHYVEPEWQPGIEIDRTQFEAARASVRLVNRGTKDANIYKLGIRADAVYRNAASTCTLGIAESEGGSVFKTQFEFVYTMEQAETTAKSLLSYFARGNYKIKFRTAKNIQPGTFLNLNTGATGFAAKVFVYKTAFDGEKETYTVECQTVSEATVSTSRSTVAFSDAGGAAAAAVASLKTSLNEGIGGYEPDAVTALKATARRDQIEITFSAPPAGLKNSICQYQIDLSRDGGETWITFFTDATETAYTFSRKEDGYPEAADLENWRIKVRSKNIYGNYSPFCESAAVDTASYGTWHLEAPQIKSQCANRAILLTFSQPPRADGRETYGTVQYRVQVCRPDIDRAADGTLNWYKPASSLDPYTAETNYKDGTGHAVAGTSYGQTMPLAGQNATPEAPTYTLYSFRVTAFSEAGESPSTVQNETARPTSCYDVVKGWEVNEKGEKVKVDGALGATNIYAEDLASISANLGDIKAGNLHSEILPGETSPNVLVDLDKEEFRVGNNPSLEAANSAEAEYIHWKKGEGLFLKLKNFLLDATGSLMRGGLQVMGLASDLFRTLIDSFGVYIEQFKEGKWQSFARMFADEAGNFCITNNPEYDPLTAEGICVEDAEIFHLNGDLLSENGEPLDSRGMHAQGSFDAPGFIKDRIFLNGTVTADLCTFDSVLKTVNNARTTGLTAQNTNAYNTACALYGDIFCVLSPDGKTLQRYNYVTRKALPPITATATAATAIESETAGFEADENGLTVSWINPVSLDFECAQIVIDGTAVSVPAGESLFVIETENLEETEGENKEITVGVQSLLAGGTVVPGKTVQWKPGTALSMPPLHTAAKQSASVSGTFTTNAVIKNGIFYSASRSGTNLVRIDLINETYLPTAAMLAASIRDYILTESEDSPYIVSIAYGTAQIYAERYDTRTGSFASKLLISFSGIGNDAFYYYWSDSFSEQRTYGNVPALIKDGVLYALAWGGFRGSSALNGRWYTVAYEYIHLLRFNIETLSSGTSSIRRREDTTWTGGSGTFIFCNGTTYQGTPGENGIDRASNTMYFMLNGYKHSVNCTTLAHAGYMSSLNHHPVQNQQQLETPLWFNRGSAHFYSDQSIINIASVTTAYPVYNALCTAKNTFFAVSTASVTVSGETVTGAAVCLYRDNQLVKTFYFRAASGAWKAYPFVWHAGGNFYAYNPATAEICAVEPATSITGFTTKSSFFSFWLKGSANFYGAKIAPNTSGAASQSWHFYTLELKKDNIIEENGEENTVCTVPYTVRSQTGKITAAGTITDDDLDLFACETAALTGEIQEIIYTAAALTAEQIEQAIRNRLHFSASGLKAGKTALVINAQNPDNVKTNCLALKNELPVGFVYTQFSGQPAPGTLFIGHWAEITSQQTGLLPNIRLWKRLL